MTQVPLLIELLLRGAAGAVVVLAVTALADLYGAKFGGLLSAFPTITAVSLILIAMRHDAAFAAQSALSTFFGLVAALVFVVGYYYGYRVASGSRIQRTVVATVIGFGLYAGFVLPYLLAIETAGITNAVLLVVGYGAARALVREPLPEDGTSDSRGSSRLEYAAKSLFGGAIVVVATLLADLFGPVFGGVFAAFPGTVAPIIVIVSLTREPAFVYRLASFMPAALLGTGGFVLAVWLAFPVLGVAAGTVLGYGCYAVLLLSLSRFEDWLRTAFPATGSRLRSD